MQALFACSCYELISEYSHDASEGSSKSFWSDHVIEMAKKSSGKSSIEKNTQVLERVYIDVL